MAPNGQAGILGEADGLVCAEDTLAVVAYLSHRNWEQFQTGSAERDLTRRTLTVSQRVLELMRDAETGQRGFLLTGRAQYRESYKAAAPEAPRRLRELEALSALRREHQRHVRELDSLVTEKLEELRHTIELRRAAGLDAMNIDKRFA